MEPSAGTVSGERSEGTQFGGLVNIAVNVTWYPGTR